MLEKELKNLDTRRLSEWERDFVSDAVHRDSWTTKQLEVVIRILRKHSVSEHLEEYISTRKTSKIIKETRLVHVDGNNFFLTLTGKASELFEPIKERFPSSYEPSLNGNMIFLHKGNIEKVLEYVVEYDIKVDENSLNVLEELQEDRTPDFEIIGEELVFEDGNDPFVLNWLNMVTFDET